MVPVVGLEPTCRLAGNFKSPVYTNFTTRAMEFYFHVGIPKVCLVRIAMLGSYSYTCHSIYTPWHPCRKSRQRFSRFFFLTYINKSCCKCRKARRMPGYLLEFYYSWVMKQGALRLKNDSLRSGRFSILRIALFSCEIACSMNTSHARSLNPSASFWLSNVNES